MLRSFTYSAMTLRVRSSGESNREAWFLTAEEGIIRATVFGGPKSRLRAHVAPFHGGTLWIYHDPVRDSRKVSDFDVKSWRPGIRELWERAMTADAAAETVLSSQGGGGYWEAAVKLVETVLDALDEADPAACSLLGVYFLWHWARILGIRPDFSFCSSCSGEVEPGKPLWYSTRNEAFFCENCVLTHGNGSNSALRLDPNALAWLNALENLSPNELLRVSPEINPSLEQARALSQAVLAAALGKRLPSWEVM